MKLAQNRCDSACKCICHRRSRFQSPRCLKEMLGSLFVGYQASPWSTQTCSNSDCRRRSKKLTYVYAFPQWFLARILLVDMSYSLSKGPELILRLMRVRPSDTGIFRVLNLTGISDETVVTHIKRLFDNGEISVLDVDLNGNTIVHVRM